MRKMKEVPKYYIINGKKYPAYQKPITDPFKGNVKKAYISWIAQRKRHKDVRYSSREFISWWLVEIKKRKKWIKPTVGRIDHSKGYFWKNIKLQEASENLAERNVRVCRKEIKIYKNNRFIKKVPSIKEAARFCKCAPNNISAVCKGTRKSLNGYVLKYA